MTLQQLETFFWTVELGSFSAAAERLYATQSAVSMRIRELERTLGVALFDRTHRSAQLTSKGRELMDYARRILDLSTELEHRIGLPEAMSGVVRLGVAEVVTTAWLPKLIALIAEQYPNVRLEIEETLTAELMASLREAELDIVLAPGHSRMPDLSVLSLGTVDFQWMASPKLGLNPNHAYRPSELAQFPIIGMKQTSFHYSALEDWFMSEHTRCRYLARCKSIAVAASMTMAGIGVAYLPVHYYQQEIQQDRLMVVKVSNRLKPVEFIAACAAGHAYSLPRVIAEHAQRISDFVRAE